MIDLFTRDVGQLYLPLPLHVLSVGRFNTIGRMVSFDGAPSFTGTPWPLINRAYYVPQNMPARFTIARFFWSNSVSAAGSADIGLYDGAGNRLLSTGTTARAGTSQIQYVGVADQSFPAGHYYLAMVASTTIANGFNSVPIDNVDNARACGILQEDLGSTLLPATMTPIAFTGVELFIFGFTQSDTL